MKKKKNFQFIYTSISQEMLRANHTFSTLLEI